MDNSTPSHVFFLAVLCWSFEESNFDPKASPTPPSSTVLQVVRFLEILVGMDNRPIDQVLMAEVNIFFICLVVQAGADHQQREDTMNVEPPLTCGS